MKTRQHIYSLAIAALCFAGTYAQSALGNVCDYVRGGLGGGEHSMGFVNAPAAAGGERAISSARLAFCDSTSIKAQLATLQRAHFATGASLPTVEVEERRCEGDGAVCRGVYAVSASFYHRNLGARTVRGKFTVTRAADGTISNTFVARALDVSGLGRRIRLGGEQAAHFFEALQQTGVFDDARLLGAENLWVSRIECTKPVVPNPVARCTMDFNGSRSRVKQNAAQVIATQLEKVRAMSGRPVLGAVNTAANLVHCSRIVVPGLPVQCEFIANMNR